MYYENVFSKKIGCEKCFPRTMDSPVGLVASCNFESDDANNYGSDAGGKNGGNNNGICC